MRVGYIFVLRIAYCVSGTSTQYAIRTMREGIINKLKANKLNARRFILNRPPHSILNSLTHVAGYAK